MKIKFTTLTSLFVAIALLFSSCSKDNNSETEPHKPSEQKYKYLSDYSATDYPTPSPNSETNIWTIYDTNATASDFDGLRAALENLTSYTITIVLKSMEVIPEDAFTQTSEVTNMQLKVSAPAATTLKSGAFSNCYNLVSASLPRVTNIEDYVFEANSSTHYSLKSLEIASDEGVEIKEIDSDAFGFTDLSEITLTVGDSNLAMVNKDSYQLGSFGTFKEIIIERYSPIEIGSKDDLAKIGVAKYHLLSDDYILTNEITLDSPWTPIGSEATPFTGSFDGCEKKISGLEITSGTYCGLFGYAEGATIKDVSIDNPSITGGTYSGALVGCVASDSTIEGCSVEMGDIESNSYAGGLIGRLFANDANIKVSACYNTSSVSSQGASANIGGLIGRANTEGSGTIEITKCYNNGDIESIDAGSNSGGVVGELSAYSSGSIAISACYNNGSIYGTSGNAGGVVGLLTSNTDRATITITSCYNNGYIRSGSNYIGGVIGCELPMVSQNTLKYNQCYFISSNNKGVGNSDSYSEMRVETLSGLNAVVNTMNSAILDAGYSDVSYTTGSYHLPSLMGEDIMIRM